MNRQHERSIPKRSTVTPRFTFQTTPVHNVQTLTVPGLKEVQTRTTFRAPESPRLKLSPQPNPRSDLLDEYINRQYRSILPNPTASHKKSSTAHSDDPLINSQKPTSPADPSPSEYGYQRYQEEPSIPVQQQQPQQPTCYTAPVSGTTTPTHGHGRGNDEGLSGSRTPVQGSCTANSFNHCNGFSQSYFVVLPGGSYVSSASAYIQDINAPTTITADGRIRAVRLDKILYHYDQLSRQYKLLENQNAGLKRQLYRAMLNAPERVVYESTTH